MNFQHLLSKLKSFLSLSWRSEGEEEKKKKNFEAWCDCCCLFLHLILQSSISLLINLSSSFSWFLCFERTIKKNKVASSHYHQEERETDLWGREQSLCVCYFMMAFPSLASNYFFHIESFPHFLHISYPSHFLIHHFTFFSSSNFEREKPKTKERWFPFIEGFVLLSREEKERMFIMMKRGEEWRKLSWEGKRKAQQERRKSLIQKF